MPERLERRYAELRADTSANGRTITGVIVRYGDRAKIGPGFTEAIAPAAFVNRDVRLNLQHRRELLLAREGAGLTLHDSSTQLSMRAELPPGRLQDDVLEGVRNGLYRGLSAEFAVRQEHWDGRDRTVERAILRNVAVCDTPAYPDSVLSELRAAYAAERRRRPPRLAY